MESGSARRLSSPNSVGLDLIEQSAGSPSSLPWLHLGDWGALTGTPKEAEGSAIFEDAGCSSLRVLSGHTEASVALLPVVSRQPGLVSGIPLVPRGALSWASPPSPTASRTACC